MNVFIGGRFGDHARPPIILSDISGITVIGMLAKLKKRHPGIRVMVLTGCTDEFYFDRCKRAGADYFFRQGIPAYAGSRGLMAMGMRRPLAQQV